MTLRNLQRGDTRGVSPILVICFIVISSPWPSLVVVSGIIAMIASARIMVRFYHSAEKIGRDFAWMVFGEFISFGMTTIFAALALFGLLEKIDPVVQSFMRSAMFSVGFFTTNRFYRRHFRMIHTDNKGGK